MSEKGSEDYTEETEEQGHLEQELPDKNKELELDKKEGISNTYTKAEKREHLKQKLPIDKQLEFIGSKKKWKFDGKPLYTLRNGDRNRNRNRNRRM